jgi:hypothetical protein
MSNKKSWQTPNLMKYGTIEQLTELSSSDIQQINSLIMNGAGAIGLFASAQGW